jgi:uncharacterized protein YjbJ (UPF0337 family)
MSNFDQTAAGLLAILARTGEIMNDGARSVREVRQRHLTQEEETMNADQLKGKWMQFKGELKQQWGKFVDNDLQQIEGSFDKVIGMLQERYGGNCVSLVRERYGEKKEELMKWADQWQQRSQSEATKGKTRREETIQKRWITE